MKYSEFKDQVIDIKGLDDVLADLSVEGEPFGYNLEDIFSVAFAPVRRYVRSNYGWLVSEYNGFDFRCLKVGTKVPGIEYCLHTLMVESYRRYHAIGSVLVNGVPALCFIRSGREGSDYVSTYILDKKLVEAYTWYLVAMGILRPAIVHEELPPMEDSVLMEEDEYHLVRLTTTDTTLSGYVWQPWDKLFGVVGVLDDDGNWVPLEQQPSPLSYNDIKDSVIGTTNRLDLVPGFVMWHLIGGDLYGITDREFLVGVESHFITCITHAYVPPLTELTVDQVDAYVHRAAPDRLYQHHVCSVLVRGTPAFYFTYVFNSDHLGTYLNIYILDEDACNEFLQHVIRLLLQDIKVAPHEVLERYGSIHSVDASDKVDSLTVSNGTRILYGRY
jgi:hypothetical protein